MGVGGGRRKERRFVGSRLQKRQMGVGQVPSREFSFLSGQETPVFQKDVKGHFGCVNAIEASRDEHFLTSGGDDRRVLLWSVASVQVEEEPKPICVMRQMHSSNIFSLAFSNKGDKLFSAGNDSALFVHDIATQNVIHRFKAEEAIYNVSTNPIDDLIILSASEDGKVRLHDLRSVEETVAVSSQGTMYCAQFNPAQANVISVCNGRDGLSIHDCRMLDRPSMRLGSSLDGHFSDGTNSVMYGQWSDDGDAIFATRSRLSPIYFDLVSGGSVEFSDDSYMNACTVKSCSFISRDLVMTGSDDWNIYVWKIPNDRPTSADHRVDTAYRVLNGHRSIVNHARYSPLNRMLFSSGVEKIIKLWSEWDLNGCYHDPIRRQMLTRRRFGDPRNDDSVDEDLNMLAFFDLLTTSGGDDEMTDTEDSLTVNRMDESSDDETPFIMLRRHRVQEDRAIAAFFSPHDHTADTDELSWTESSDQESSENSTQSRERERREQRREQP